MKIRINSIGFGDVKNIQKGENIIKIGFVIAIAGIAVAIVGNEMIKRTSWIAGSTEGQIKTIQDIFREFDSGCNS